MARFVSLADRSRRAAWNVERLMAGAWSPGPPDDWLLVTIRRLRAFEPARFLEVRGGMLREEHAAWLRGDGHTLDDWGWLDDLVDWVAAEHDAAQPDPGWEPKGRILLADLTNSDISGGPEGVSAGFFDVRDQPPPLTWLGAWRESGVGRILAWVPEPMIGFVDAGIRATPFDNLSWFAGDPLLREPAHPPR